MCTTDSEWAFVTNYKHYREIEDGKARMWGRGWKAHPLPINCFFILTKAYYVSSQLAENIRMYGN